MRGNAPPTLNGARPHGAGVAWKVGAWQHLPSRYFKNPLVPNAQTMPTLPPRPVAIGGT